MILNRNQQEKLKDAAKNHLGASNRTLARKFHVSKETIRKNLKKLGVTYHKRAIVPKYSEKQLREIPAKCRLLRRQFLKNGVSLIIDDEKYFTFGWSKGEQNRGFYTDNIAITPDNIRFIPKSKFESKVLVWCAISLKGISQLHIQDSRAPAIKSETYISKCLTKLRRFIRNKHENDDIIFWPDNASSHYAKKTINWLTENNIPFVPKEANPPNIPKARPIEDFWNLLCQQVYKKGWEARTTDELILKIKKSVKKIDYNVVQQMLKNVRSKLRKIEDDGPLSLYKSK